MTRNHSLTYPRERVKCELCGASMYPGYTISWNNTYICRSIGQCEKRRKGLKKGFKNSAGWVLGEKGRQSGRKWKHYPSQSKEYRKEYMKKYRAENKDRINARNKERYRNDPEYRQRRLNTDGRRRAKTRRS